MPDELKIDRSYHEALRRIGVKNPGEVRVGVPLQLQAISDDFRHLVAPVQVPVVSIFVTVAALPGSHSGFAFQAGSGGCWVERVTNWDAAAAAFWVAPAEVPWALIAVGAPVAPVTVFGPAPLSALWQATTVAIPGGASQFPGAHAQDLIGLPFFLSGGDWLYLMHTVANTQANIEITWREVPAGADTGL